MPTRTRPPHPLLVWGLYLLLAIALTWPVARNLTSHLPGDGGDDPALAWNIWWLKYALLNLGQSPFPSDSMFYPVGINLAFYTLTPLNGITAMPLTLNFGVVTASNLHLWFSFVVGGYGMYLLVRYLLNWELAHQHLRYPFGHVGKKDTSQEASLSFKVRSSLKVVSLTWLAPLISGICYAFASSKLFYVALGQFNIASTHWIPFTVLFVMRTAHQPTRWRNPLLAGFFLTCQAWAEMTYASFLLIFIGLYWLWEMGHGLTRINTDFLNAPDEQERKDKREKATISRGDAEAQRSYNSASLRLREKFDSTKVVLWQSKLCTPFLKIRVYPRVSVSLSFILIGLTFLIGLSPILAAMLPDMLTEGDFLVEGTGFAEAFSADLIGFLIPTMHHPWLGDLIQQSGVMHFDKGQHIYLGLVLLGGAIIALPMSRRHAELRFWLMSALLFGLLCLGPSIIVNGYNTEIPGPFVILQQLPFFKGNRYPSRFAVMLILSLSVIVGYVIAIGYAKIMAIQHLRGGKQTSQVIILLLIPALFLFEHLSAPLPQSDMRLPSAYHALADTPPTEPHTVLNIPFAWRNGFDIMGAWTTQFMFSQFYQTHHQQRHLQGNTSRNPAYKFQYFSHAPVINSLLALQTGKSLPPERIAHDQPLASAVLAFFDIRYIIIGPDESDSPRPVTPRATMPYIEQVFPVTQIYPAVRTLPEPVEVLPEPVEGIDPSTSSGYASANSGYDNEQYIIYQVDESVSHPTRYRIDSNNPLTPLYLGEGWGTVNPEQPLLAQREAVRLMLPLTQTAHRLTIQARRPEAFQPNSHPTISLSLNGWQSESQPMSPDLASYQFDIPAQATNKGLNNLWLKISELSLRKLIPPEVTAYSAGEEVGGRGHIYLNGRDISPNKRGYNIALISPDGSYQVANFDTHADVSANDRLAEFISTALPDQTIALAVADEASFNLTETTINALQSVNIQADLRDCFRCSQAIIRQPDGTVYSRTDPLQPVNVTNHIGLTEPTISALIHSIEVEPIPSNEQN
ncbi:interleukin-like EMT inducer domain-containing protein [Anaerolineales bacterium HSG25]|nr:interleukin-like EMT inducer domain-containing protein [Anaerolineales bacterium HSG25]